MKRRQHCYSLWAALLLTGVGACKKEVSEDLGIAFVNGVRYYRFTANDRLWLQANVGDEWRFQNAQGYQRVYRVGQVITRIKEESRSTSMGIPSFSKLLGYNDLSTVRIGRTDSARGYLELRFYRDAAMRTNLNSGGYDENSSRFYAEGEDHEFVGNTDLISDYFHCRGLKFPSGNALNGPFQQLTVRGRQYPEVVAFVGAARGTTCPAVPSSYMQELYYDRQAGLVRLVSLTGEVWDRVR